jgi:predicted glycosyltransferase
MVNTEHSPRCVFHVRNRRGLGHMMRGLNMATAMLELAPQARIAFHLRTAPAPGFWPHGIACVVDESGGVEQSAPALVRRWESQVQVFDTMLPRPEDLSELRAAAPGCRLVFVMRRCLPQEQAALYSHPSLKCMDLVLVPHAAADFDLPIPAWLEPRCRFVGPIVRRPDPAARQALEARLGLAPGEFLVTSTVGGGGFADQAERFFDTVGAAHRQLLAAPPAARWRHIVVLGPNFQGEFAAQPGMTVIDSEPDLVGLLARSDLVVAEGGYNTVTELSVVRTPAIFMPSQRGKDDQVERVSRLAAKGCGIVLQPGDADGLARALRRLGADAPARARMRDSYPEVRPGNGAAAQHLLSLCGWHAPGVLA